MKRLKYISLIVVITIVCTVGIQITAFAADNFSSGGTVTPEQDIYYVGDTVKIDDLFKNKSGNNATSVSVEYYYRLDGANSVYSGSPISLGTISAGSSKSYAFNYTFKESDIGEYRIGAKIKYTMVGVADSEYSSGHNFIVQAAPTPTVSPTPTIESTPTPEPTPEPTVEPTATMTPEPTLEVIDTFTPEPSEVIKEEVTKINPTRKENKQLKALLQDKSVVMVLIIIIGVILLLLIILIVVLMAKKK